MLLTMRAATSMQHELAVDRFQLRRLDQLGIRDLDRVQRTFEFGLPDEGMQHPTAYPLRSSRDEIVTEMAPSDLSATSSIGLSKCSVSHAGASVLMAIL